MKNDVYVPMFGRPVTPWVKKFIWWPIDTVDQGYVWLRFVKRRRIQKHTHLDGGTDQWWQYAVNVPHLEE